MPYAIRFEAAAERDLADLPADVRRRVSAKINALAVNPRGPNSEKLAGSKAEPLYRIRAGDYRIVYAIRDDVLLVLVVRVGHRREVYR